MLVTISIVFHVCEHSFRCLIVSSSPLCLLSLSSPPIRWILELPGILPLFVTLPLYCVALCVHTCVCVCVCVCVYYVPSILVGFILLCSLLLPFFNYVCFPWAKLFFHSIFYGCNVLLGIIKTGFVFLFFLYADYSSYVFGLNATWVIWHFLKFVL